MFQDCCLFSEIKATPISFFGNYRFSHVEDPEDTEQGFASYMNISKVAGKFQFGLANNIESDTYNPNDMGFFIQQQRI